MRICGIDVATNKPALFTGPSPPDILTYHHHLYIYINTYCNYRLRWLYHTYNRQETRKVFVTFIVKPIKTTGGGWNPPPTVILPSIKKIFSRPIPETSLIFPTFGCGYPYECFFFEKFCCHPLTALLRHPVQKYFFVFCFNQKNLFTNPS